MVPIIFVISLIILLVKESNGDKIDPVSYPNILYDEVEEIRIIMNAHDGEYNEIRANYKTGDVNKVKKIIEYVNTIQLENAKKSKIGSRTPDAWIDLLDVRGEMVDSLDFHGDLLWYDGELWRIDMTVYNQIKEMCDELSNPSR